MCGIVRPTVCLWPTPDWLWTNADGQGHYDTLNVRAWMEKLGVKENVKYPIPPDDDYLLEEE